ncbi:DNA-directed RNA polymerase subunit beta [Paenibacillus faecalis]|uniref:DNA-directed RNA polymerase subunit beta n=1 Tax=Paenibacillus faecalis TaxID=2079532 RepID=UPI000D10E9AA|nr:DNA-directed RNA polymerase subunit beta [Paenibacillus faecalis]
MSEASEPVRRKTPGWKIALRIIVPTCLLLSLVGGMVVGYAVIGKGDIAEAFQWSTWKHVFDLVFAS